VQVLRDLQQCSALDTGHAVTIGTYDGVHIGHQAVIRSTQQIAQRLGLKTAVVTFLPHPATVIRPESAPLILTDIDQKLDLLEQCGVDTTAAPGRDGGVGVVNGNSPSPRRWCGRDRI